ncbi:hypothetical protein [Segetibacter sp. 3557_3]|uniref:hypothetical protein n=1 Tax=Segetibacter sp. 3557_3 TaxID=2547429 RepID=UPI001405222F|nr:hypothetical protein [Segetibacter sp. 3557_3]
MSTLFVLMNDRQTFMQQAVYTWQDFVAARNLSLMNSFQNKLAINERVNQPLN